uniref:Uncharacterized protein n=1 Tax=Cacopsylla melanoneura TaxID=428564 RepID=A0A8D8U5E1_9HEMI
MERHTVLVFLAITTVSAYTEAEPDLEEIVRKKSGITIENDALYEDETFDTFLRSLRKLDLLVEKNKEKYYDDIVKAIHLGREAAKTYRREDENIHDWCTFTIKLIDHLIHGASSKNATFIATMTAIGEGIKTAKEAITHVDEVVDQLGEIDLKLTPIPGELTNEIPQLSNNALKSHYVKMLKRIQSTMVKYMPVMRKVSFDLRGFRTLLGIIQAEKEIADMFKEYTKDDMQQFQHRVTDYLKKHEAGPVVL